MGRINGLGWFPRCSPLANFENINQLPPYPDMVIPISGLMPEKLAFRQNGDGLIEFLPSAIGDCPERCSVILEKANR
ncbi:hypothetical protein ABGK51_004619, partial [Escherichia coli]|nr:hypothetical protein [Escherichia coli]